MGIMAFNNIMELSLDQMPIILLINVSEAVGCIKLLDR